MTVAAVILSASPDESIRLWKPLDLSREITRKADAILKKN